MVKTMNRSSRQSFSQSALCVLPFIADHAWSGEGARVYVADLVQPILTAVVESGCSP